MSTDPESKLLARRLTEEEQKWTRALSFPRKVSGLAELESIYSQITKKDIGVWEVWRRDPVFQGLLKMVDSSNNNEECLGYQCNNCNALYAGKPRIVSSNIPSYINFDCGVCNTTLASRTV